MALDEKLIGKVYPPSPVYEVGREKIREFATAIGDWNPAYHDAEAARALGHRDLVAPPTFVFTIAFRAMSVATLDPELGLDYSRVVHGDQRFAYRRPIVAGDALVCVNTVEEITSRGGHDFLTTRSDVSTDAGEPVVTVWAKLVQRGEE